MIRKARITATTVLVVALHCNLAVGQLIPPTIINIDVENIVEYQSDISDLPKVAANPIVTPAAPPRNFYPAAGIGDIVAINGQPAKGTVAFRAWAFSLSQNPIPGSPSVEAIADTTRTSIRSLTVEILKIDGTPIGTIMVMGMGGGAPPPGAPSEVTGTNFAIVGGTGAFLGARGQFGQVRTPQIISARAASMAEDPINRRLNGGGKIRYVLQMFPMSVPQIVVTGSGPAVTHSNDFTLVTASKPAAAGEILSLFATGLGPTLPGVDSGQPFPSSPLAVVNSPVEVTVNGKSAEVLGAVGLPGAVDGYQVNFRVPQNAVKGVAKIQVSAAWFTSTATSITVQ
jgi:hypothetical protein